MTIFTEDQLANGAWALNATDAAKNARSKASFAYKWLAPGSPKAILPWQDVVNGGGRAWTNTSTYKDGHCDANTLNILVDGKIDKDHCGAWADPAPLKGCSEGFYGTKEEPETCPPGVFCPEGFTCFVACLYGGSCVPAEATPEGKCLYRPLKPPHAPTNGFDGVNGTVCPGAAFENLCPEGFFCPDPTVTPKRCSAGHYCRLGSFKPSPCPFYATCGESGLDAPDVQTTAAVMLLSVFAMFFVVIRGSKAARGCLRRYRDQQKERLAARLEDLLEARAAGRAADVLGTTPPVVARGASDGFSPELPRRENTRSGSGPARWELPSLPRKSAAERVDLAFDALGCTVRADGKQLRVLSGVTGAIRGGRVAAIMGPSGAGKTSLLNVLAGRTSRGAALDGRLLVNGEKHAAAAARLRPATGYVPQEDVLCAALTVRECLEFSAATRLPPSTPCSKRRAVVDDVMQVLGLAAHRNRVVGDVLKRGLSGGQRKRVNVGTELVADPTLLFADEPTSGLDSATSLDVIGAFHACAARGATVAVVLHQPSIQIYRLFDDVLLLVPGGRTAYLGAPERAKPWFANLGFPVPAEMSPPDYYMQLLSGDAGPNRDLAQEWARGGTPPIAPEPANGPPPPRRATPGFWRQLGRQLRRALLQQRRSAGSLVGDIVTQVLAGGFLGVLYADFDFKNLQLVNFMVSIALGMTMTLAAVPTLSKDRAVFLRECRAAGGGGLSPAAAFLGKALADVPRLSLLAAAFVLAFYPLARPRAGLGIYVMLAVCDALAASGFGYCAAAVLEPASAQLGALCIALLFAMFSGVHPTVTQMPVALKIIHYASPDRYFVEQLFVEEVVSMSEAFRLPPTFYSSSDSSALAQMLAYGYLTEDPSIYWHKSQLRTLNAATLLAVALVSRALAFGLLIRANAEALGRPPLFCGRVAEAEGGPATESWRFRGAMV